MLATLALISAISIVLVWLVYPATLAALAAVVQTIGAPAERKSPVVSVVLATREPVDAVRARVDDLLRTAYDPTRLEIIVALDACDDHLDPGLLVLPDERVRVVASDPPGGKAAALNAGIRAARGEVVVFADTHQRFECDTIPRLVEALADPRFGAASGRLELPTIPGARSVAEYYWTYERWVRRSEARVHSAVGVTGAVYAMRRDLWTPLRTGLILDDVYVPMKLVLRGYRIAFVDEARAWETRRTTPAQEYARKVRTLTGVIQLCAWLPAVLVPLRNPIWLQFVFHKLLRLLTPYWLFAIVLWLAAAGWALLRNAPLPLVLLLGAGVLLAALAKPVLLRRVHRMIYQGTLMQLAVVAATFNGLMGRWDVWRK